MKKIISVAIILCIAISLVTPAYAQRDDDNIVSPMFSFGYSKSDPSFTNNYGGYGAARKGNVIFETILASMLIAGITDAIMAVLPFNPCAAEAAKKIASFASGAGATWALTSTQVYYKLFTAYHNTLPGFYQKLRYDWYTDNSYSQKISTTYVYRFKA